MTDLKLAFGCRAGLPEGVAAAWGARWIYPNDFVHDRQDLKGENVEPLKDWLNGGALNAARIRALELAKTWKMFPSSDTTQVLVDDETGTIIANPQSSHGYLYVAGWLKADVPGPQIWRFEDSGEAYDASQSDDRISDGDILVCEDGVIGFLCSAWPVAVSDERGSFHRMADPSSTTIDGQDYSRSIAMAVNEVYREKADAS